MSGAGCFRSDLEIVGPFFSKIASASREQVARKGVRQCARTPDSAEPRRTVYRKEFGPALGPAKHFVSPGIEHRHFRAQALKGVPGNRRGLSWRSGSLTGVVSGNTGGANVLLIWPGFIMDGGSRAQIISISSFTGRPGI